MGFLGANFALAFWVDALTYVISAILLAGLFIPPVAREASKRLRGAVGVFADEMRDGWQFLRSDAFLFQNTMVSILAQLSIGATLALMVVYAERTLEGDTIGFPTNYAILEAAIGLGNLVGGFVIGAIGAKLRKGWLVITGFAFMGLATIVLGLTSNEMLAVGGGRGHRHLQSGVCHPQSDAVLRANSCWHDGPGGWDPVEHRDGSHDRSDGSELRARGPDRPGCHHRRNGCSDRARGSHRRVAPGRS